MFYSKRVTMKCPAFEAVKDNSMEKSSAAADSKMLHLKTSPVKEPKPQPPSTGLSTVLYSTRDGTSVVHNKENSTSRDYSRTQEECFEDSGYLSLHNSQIDHSVKEDDDHALERFMTESCSATQQDKAILLNTSPFKYQGRTKASHPVSVVVSPVDCFRRKPALLSSTPSSQRSNTYLPILKFEQAVCEELAKSFKKNKKYDWSVISEVAQQHHLDRVIGGHMGLEYVDMFTSLMSRNMKCILTNILSLLEDLDLISCRKVSKTWKKIICEDKAAFSRCQHAEQALGESRSSLRRRSGLTDTARTVLSCMQTLASPSTSSSVSSSSSSNRSSQKGSIPTSQSSRFNEYSQAARSLKQHESLRTCRRCGSPAICLAEAQRATCTRSGCLFEFCTCCQEPFHGSSPCRTVQPQSQISASKMIRILPSSTRSKRSIRRL